MTNSLTNRSAAWRKVCECLGSVSAASRRLTLLSLLLFLVGIINAWGAEQTITLNFYDASKLSSTSGTDVTLNYAREHTTCSDNTLDVEDVITAASKSGTVQYGKNGGVTFGANNSNAASWAITFDSDYEFYKIEIVGTHYDTNNFSVNGNSADAGSLNAKGTVLASCTNTLLWEFESGDELSGALTFAKTATKRGTIYTITLYYDDGQSSGTTYTVGYVVQPTGAGSVTLGATSLAPNATTSATATANDGYEFSSWEISGTGASLSSTSTNPTTVTMGSADATVTANFSCVTPTWDPNLVTETVNYTTGGSAAALTVAASANNATVNYQWQTSTDNTNWSNTGSNSSSNTSLTPSTDAAGTTYYRCIATNAASGCSATATSNVTTVTVSAPTPATITLQNYDGDATTTGYYSGGSFTLPSTNDFTCGELTFVGWSSVTIDNSATKPSAATYHEPGESVTLEASNTFYAVFAEASGGGGAATYTKVTTISAGTYLMATETATEYTPTSTLAYTGDNGSGKRGGVIGVSISDGVISTKPATALEITVTLGTGDDAGYFAMYDGSKYITQGAKNEFAFVDDISYQWNLNANGQIHQKGTFDNSNDNRIYVDHGNSGSQTNLFKPMKVRTEGNNSGSYFYHAYLFKKSSTISYSNYTTNCVNMIPVYLDAYHFGDTDGAKFAIYSWRNADASDNKLSDAFMTKVEDCYYGHLYEGEMPDNHDRVIFLRNAPAAVTPVKEGGNKWNQTSNISTDGDKDLFTIASGGAGDTYTGSWSVYTPYFAVTFDKNGAGETTTWPSDQCIANGGKASEPSSPQTMGKTFVGWYQEAEGANAWVFNTNTVTAATTIYAKWNDVATKTIYLDTDFGDGDDNKWDKDNVVIFAHAYIDGTSIYTDVKATSAISSCQPHVYAFTIPGNADYVTFARCATGATSIIWDGGSKNVYNKVSLPVQASKDYYLITGWGSDGVSTGRLETTTFTPVSYTISYNAGTSGSGSRDSESKACGVAFALPNAQVFTRDGYTMDGWATEDGGAKEYVLGGSYTTDADQTFYPHWTEASYSVTLTTNGGTINTGDVTSYTYGTGATLPTDVTKAHATFQGWYASSTFEGERVYSIGTTEYGNKQYYAKWEDVKWTVTWKANGGIVRTDTEVVEGGKVASVPSAPADLTTDPNGCDAEFVGWVIEANDPGALNISSQSSTPSGMFTNVAGSPTITGNVTFVAIYRQEQ